MDQALAQRWWDEAYTKIMKQGRRCTILRNVNSCCYSDGFGNRCAVGHIAPDAWVMRAVEVGIGDIGDLLKEIRLREEYCEPPDDATLHLWPEADDEEALSFLDDLQMAHDDARDHHFIADFRQAMLGIAKTYRLSTEAATRVEEPA